MRLKNILFTLIVFIVIFVVYFLFVRQIYSDMDKRGQFGDMFGALNAMFSGLAFLGIIYTITLQREELGLQRKELELTRQELKRTAEAQELSQQELAKQAASLKAAAKLSGLSSLLQRYTALKRDDSWNADKWNSKANDVTLQIEEIINPK